MSILLNIDVPTLSEGERFYTSAFGLIPGRSLGEKVLELLGWPVPVYLLEKPEGTIGASIQQRDYGRHWTPLHFDVAVPDINDAVSRALASGATLEIDTSETSYGRIAMLADPFGHGFCLIEFNSEGYDAIALRPPPAAKAQHR